MAQTLLLADPDRQLRKRLAHELTADGYIVAHVPSERAIAGALLANSPDLLLLGDFGGPGAAARITATLRAGDYTGQEPDPTPVLVLTDETDTLAMMRCFEAGADDFRPKGITYLELRGRVRAILRRTAQLRRPRRVRIDGLSIDLDGRDATWRSEPLDLTGKEFALLARLASEPDRVWTKDELLRDVWGYLAAGRTRTVDAHASRLRRKLARAGARGWVLNCRGIGYRLTDIPTTPPTDQAA
jgi:DNA-binding response OmpR family regulator